MNQQMKQILLLVCAFAVVISCGTVFAQAAETDLALEKMEIVLPTDATEVEKTAAQELTLYVNKMTGVTMKTVTEGQQSGKAVYVGATQFAADNEVIFEDNKFGEGWAIKAVDGNLVLTGGAARGTLYAVYHLLEDVLGVRWWNMWEEDVPALSSAVVPADYSDAGVPDFLYRDIFVSNAQEETLFFVRNRANGWTSNAPAEYGGEEYFALPAHCHTIGMYFPAFYRESDSSEYQAWIDAVGNPDHVDYFEEHPEWFEVCESGGRSSTGHMCMTNEEFRKAFAEKVLANIEYCYAKADTEGVPRPRYFSLALDDKPGNCYCEPCQASIEQSGSSGNVIKFVNAIANAVAEEYPEVYLETLAYWHCIKPPLDDAKAAKNVVIRYANNFMDVLHDFNHANNADNLEQLQKWTNAVEPGNLYIWDYAVVYPTNGVLPSMYKYGTNMKLAKELGVNGYFIEHEDPINADFWDMKLWLMTKLMEDADQDYDALMDEFIYGYYGEEAGQYIHQYLDYVIEKAKASDTKYPFGEKLIPRTFLSVEDILKGDDIFNQAFVAAGDDEVVLKRLRAARGGLDRQIAETYVMLEMSAAYSEIEWTIDRQELLERLITTMKEQMELRGDHCYRFSPSTALSKYELDLRLLVGDQETVPEETEEATEPPVTEENVVPETTEPVVEEQEDNGNPVVIIAVAAGVVVLILLAVLLRKKVKKQ